MIKVKVIETFNDAVELCVRNIDDEFLCTEERYEVLKEHNVVIPIGVIIEEEKKTTKRVSKKK